jgi:excisionase family DNA binding protein
MKLLTTKEAAEKLGVGYVRVNQLIKEGRLPAEKMGRDYFIKESNLKLVEDRKPGRPSKQLSEQKKSTNKSKG